MDPKALEKAFEKYPGAKAVICAHLYGTPAKIDEIRAICDAHHVPLYRGCGGILKLYLPGKMTGTFGDYGIFLFNGNKIITTSGGGMLVSRDGEAIEKPASFPPRPGIRQGTISIPRLALTTGCPMW